MKNINNLKVGKEYELRAVAMALIYKKEIDLHKFVYRHPFDIKYISCDYVIADSNKIILTYE